MKKRFWALLLCCVCLVSLLALPLSAATTSDVENLISYRWLKYQFDDAEISSPSPGVIRLYFPFLSPGTTVHESFGMFQLFNYCESVGFVAGTYSFLNLPFVLYNGNPGSGGDELDIVLSISSTSGYWISYTLDNDSCLIMSYPVICAGELNEGNVSDSGSWPVIYGNNLIPNGYTHAGDLTYDDGYAAGKADGYNEGYRVGYQNGVDSVSKDEDYQAGYTDGYAAGSQSVIDSFGLMVNDFWKEATYTVYWSYSGVAESSSTFTPSFIQGGVVFPNFTELFFDVKVDEELEHDMVDYYYVRIQIPDSSAFNYDSTGIFISGSYPLLGSTFRTVDGKSYTSGTFTSSAGERLMIGGQYPRNLIVNEIVLNMNGYSYNANVNTAFSLYCSDTVYSNGYAAGYADAMNSNADSFTQTAFRKGYNEGYDHGFADGNVVATEGNFASLVYAVVEAPFNTFSSLFNFEILGVNMLGFVGSLLTLVVVLFVVKKVVL